MNAAVSLTHRLLRTAENMATHHIPHFKMPILLQSDSDRHSGRRELREEPMVAQIEVLKQNHKFIHFLFKNIQ